MNVADSEMSFFGRENLRNSAFQRGKTFFIYSFKRNSSAPCVILLSRCVRNLKSLHVKGNRVLARQTHSRDIINILLTSFTQSVMQITDRHLSPQFTAQLGSAIN